MLYDVFVSCDSNINEPWRVYLFFVPIQELLNNCRTNNNERRSFKIYSIELCFLSWCKTSALDIFYKVFKSSKKNSQISATNFFMHLPFSRLVFPQWQKVFSFMKSRSIFNRTPFSILVWEISGDLIASRSLPRQPRPLEKSYKHCIEARLNVIHSSLNSI
jgi:hypothetical protein